MSGVGSGSGHEDGDHAPRHGVRVSDLGSRRLGTRAFAVLSTSTRFRRPTDVVLLTLSVVLIIVTATQVGDPGDFESSLADWLASLPALLDFVWGPAFDFVQVWVVIIAVLATVRRGWRLLRNWAVSHGLTVAGGALVGGSSTTRCRETRQRFKLLARLGSHRSPPQLEALDLHATSTRDAASERQYRSADQPAEPER